MKLNKTAIIAILGLNIGVYSCSANNSSTDNSASADTSAKTNGTATAYTDDVREIVGMDHGKRTIRIAGDERISHPELKKNQASRFIVMSKKDYYLYVYEGYMIC